MKSSHQARSQGGANGFSTPTTNLVAPAKNLLNITDKHAGQLAKKKGDTLPHPHVVSVE
jgi:hypothetical protein